MKLLTLSILMGLAISMHAQQNIYDINIDVDKISNTLKDARPIFSGLDFNDKPVINLPYYDGTEMQFTYERADILHPDMQAVHPDLRSYFLQSIDDPTLMARLNISASGPFLIFKKHGEMAVIKTLIAPDGTQKHEGRKLESHPIICEAGSELELPQEELRSMGYANNCFQNGDILRTFRMAIAVTYEYAEAFGFTLSSVNAQIVNDLSAISLIYETELAISFQLAPTNDTLTNLILNASSANDDPFTDPEYTGLYTTMPEGSNFIDANLDNADFDMGHTFHITTQNIAAGLANIGTVCEDTPGNNFKARGHSILRYNENYQLPAHEIGHQLSAQHNNYGCSSSGKCQRYEPGGGSSIMGTGANCTPTDDYTGLSPYFGISSIQAILDFVTTGDVMIHNSSCTATSTGRGMCAGTTMTGNNVPVANANPNNRSYTIPQLTPFVLIGEGTDADGDVLSYNWEQYDTDYSNSLVPEDAGNAGTNTDPLFRSFPPSDTPIRYCPQLNSILNGNNTAGTGEDLPEESRNMTWRFSVRDNFAGACAISCDETNITVDTNAGPFLVTSQNTPTSWVADGSTTATITWDVAGTDAGNINCANVDILLSTDGGQTFPYTLAEGTANNGSFTTIIPSYPTDIGRIRIMCSDNIFFDINDENIVISSSCTAHASTFSPDTDIVAEAGDSILDLSLEPDYGSIIPAFAGQIDNGDTPSNLSFDDMGTCIGPANPIKYDLHSFVVDNSGTYTFNIDLGSFGLIMSLYENEYSSASVCNNWLGSSGTLFGSAVTLNNSMTMTLTQGITYHLVVSNFNTSYPSLPDAYSVSVGGAGNAYDGSPPPAGFDYTYVVVNDSTEQISSFEMDGDLRNTANYPGSEAGISYRLYGLSYDNSVDLSAYVGTDFTVFLNDLIYLGFCGSLSQNDIKVTITGEPSVACPPDLTGVNALTGIENGNTTYISNGLIESVQSLLPGANIFYKSATGVMLNPGFQVDTNAGFSVEMEGCQ